MSSQPPLADLPTTVLPGRPLLEGWLAFTADSRYLLVHSVDGWLQVWDVGLRALVYEYDRHFLLGVAPGLGPSRVTAFARDWVVVLTRRGKAWAAQEYPHSLPTDDGSCVPDLWVRSMVVGKDEAVVATWRWVASFATADPARVLQFHPLAGPDKLVEGLCVRRSERGHTVSFAFRDFGSIDLRRPHEPAVRFVSQDADGRVIGDLTLDGHVARLCHWLYDRTATAIVPLSGRRCAAVFHGPDGALEIRPLANATGKEQFWATESGRAVIGVAAGRVSRWTGDGRPPTTVAVPTAGPIIVRPSPGGERCVLLNYRQKLPLRSIAVDLTGGQGIGHCVGHPAGLTPYTFSPCGRWFASVVTANTETDFPGLCTDGTVVISDLRP